MANDASLALRRAVVTALRANSALIALVPAAQLYGMRSPPDPAYPFTRYGSPDAQPFLASCIDGATVNFTIHAFSQSDFEDECGEIDAAVASAIDEAVLDLGAASATVRWIGSQIMADAAEASVWHGLNRFQATVV